jgi:nucleotide-binding universal stress UspA family protein
MPSPTSLSICESTLSEAETRGQQAVILLATNGSPSAIAATSLASSLAARSDAALRILHVVAPVEFRVGRLAPTRIVEQKLDCPYDSPVLLNARQLAWKRGAAATLQLVAGEPARAIVSAAEHVDLLVIGGRDQRASARLRACTRRWVEAHVGCPVLACPSPLSPEFRPELQPTRIGPRKPRFVPR